LRLPWTITPVSLKGLSSSRPASTFLSKRRQAFILLPADYSWQYQNVHISWISTLRPSRNSVRWFLHSPTSIAFFWSSYSNVSGLFHKFKAEEWCELQIFSKIRQIWSSVLVNHQHTIAKRFMHGLHTITGQSSNILARRPFFVFWFMGQISRYAALFCRDFQLLTRCGIRALSLWECENSLAVAIDVCKALIPALD
jgi:hypothetical protein